jgi:hypothetical protein
MLLKNTPQNKFFKEDEAQVEEQGRLTDLMKEEMGIILDDDDSKDKDNWYAVRKNVEAEEGKESSEELY